MDGQIRLPINMQRTYFLRWKFDLPSGNRHGIWSNPGKSPKDYAWCVNKTGLVRASIESKNIYTGKVSTKAEYDGHMFCNFKWVTATKIPVIGFKQIKVTGAVIGLTLVTTDFETTVFVDGKIWVKPRLEADKKLHYASYGQ